VKECGSLEIIFNSRHRDDNILSSMKHVVRGINYKETRELRD